MYVYPFVDDESGEIVLVYRDGGDLSAEIYKKHVAGAWTHYNAVSINREYLGGLRQPAKADEQAVETAVELFGKTDSTTTVPIRNRFPLKEWREARSRQKKDRVLSSSASREER